MLVYNYCLCMSLVVAALLYMPDLTKLLLPHDNSVGAACELRGLMSCSGTCTTYDITGKVRSCKISSEACFWHVGGDIYVVDVYQGCRRVQENRKLCKRADTILYRRLASSGASIGLPNELEPHRYEGPCTHSILDKATED